MWNYWLLLDDASNLDYACSDSNRLDNPSHSDGEIGSDNHCEVAAFGGVKLMGADASRVEYG